MRSFLIAAFAVCAVSCFAYSTLAEDKAEGKEVKGVLIDVTCGEKQLDKDDPEQSAAGHPKSCALKCGKDGGYAVLSGKNLMKLDDKGNELATKYLENEANATQVVVIGTPSEDGKSLAVSEIKPAGEKSEGESGESKKS